MPMSPLVAAHQLPFFHLPASALFRSRYSGNADTDDAFFSIAEELTHFRLFHMFPGRQTAVHTGMNTELFRARSTPERLFTSSPCTYR